MSAIIIFLWTITSVTYVSATAGPGSVITASAPAASTSAASPSSAQDEAAMHTNKLIVYWLDITLLCVVGLFFLAELPRVFARFSEWGRGHFLSSSSTAKRNTAARSNPPVDRIRRQYTNTTLDYSTEQSHTYVMHGNPEKGGKGNSSSQGSTSPPPHIPALSTMLYPISSVFLYSVAPQKSVGKLTIAVLFIIAIITLTFVLGGEPLTEPNRLGWFTTGLIPVTVALGTKNNLVGMFVGMGYEKLNFFHRWVGIVSFVAANLHAIGYIYKWAIAKTVSEDLEKPFIIHGIISLVGLELLFLGSLGWVRNKTYNLFIFSHVIGYCTFLIAACFHRDGCINWVILAACIYALDHLIRIFKTRFAIARIKAVPELGLVRVEVPSIKSGWRAGQHVRLRVLSSEMGAVRWSVAHPFTIANASNSEADTGMVLLVKKVGDWTTRLYNAASRAGYYAPGSSNDTQREMRVIVEGPYGGLGNMVISSFSAVILVGGGSGITFTLSQAEELVQVARKGKSAIKFIEIIWITQDQNSLTPLIPEFSTLLENVAPIPGVLLKITIFYSRASKRSLDTKGQSNAAYIASLAPELSVQPGRPMLPRILDGLVRLTASVEAKGVAVGVCGPIELVEDVQRASRSISSDLRSACGGVEVHEEVFGW